MNQASPPQRLTDADMTTVFDALPMEVLAVLFTFPQLFVAGGAIRAVLAGEEVKDIDIFATDTAIIPEAVRHYVRQCGDLGMIETLTPCTVTVKGEGLVPVQFVNNVAYESPRQCIEQFDFTVCQAALWRDIDGWQTLCFPDFIRDVADKRLVYTAPDRVEAPGGSLWRAFKYAQRGYSITQETLAKLVNRLMNGVILEAKANPPAVEDIDDDDAMESAGEALVRKSFHMPGHFGGSY